MKRNLFNTFIGFLSIILSSCVNNTLISLNDCAHEDDEIQVEIGPIKKGFSSLRDVTVKKDGNVWTEEIDPRNSEKEPRVFFVDVNFDGYTDILIGNEKLTCLFRWDKNEERFVVDRDRLGWFDNYPIFSNSEKAYYSLSEGHGTVGAYIKNKLVDSEFKEEERLLEVYSSNYDYNTKSDDLIKSKYTLAKYNPEVHRTTAELSCNEISELPKEWQEVIAKMEEDYKTSQLYANKEQELLRKKFVEDSIKASWNEEEANKVYPQVCEEVWINMGIESDDGHELYWASSDLIFRKDKTFGLAGYGEFGSKFGWGDKTGLLESQNGINAFGGSNPPSSIIGNPEFDIVAAHMKKPARLPSYNEWKRLLDNCSCEFKAIDWEQVLKNGLPSWVQGQWMTEAVIPKVSGNALISLSVKIDGLICSVIATQGGHVTPIYEGVYDYFKSSHELKMGGLTVIVDENSCTMATENGYQLRKVKSGDSKRYGLLLTSKINGNELFFPIISPNAVIKSGDMAMEFETAQDNEYWAGNLSDEDKQSAWMFYVKGSKPQNIAIGFDKRNNMNCVRPVTSEPITVSIGTVKKQIN